MEISSHPMYKKYDSDNVVSETFRFYKKHFIPLFLVSFIINLIIIIPIFQLGVFDAYITIIEDQYFYPGKDFFMSLFIICLISFIALTIGHLFICYYTTNIHRNKNNMSLLLNAIRKYYVRFIILAILSVIILTIGSFIGILLILIGSVIAMLYFSTVLVPATPILIIEKKEPLSAISRAFSLTHKDFWGALGALLLLILIYIVISIIIGVISGLPVMVDIFQELANGEHILNIITNKELYTRELGFAGISLNVIFSALLFPVFPIFSIFYYYKLKFEEDNKEPAFEKRPY